MSLSRPHNFITWLVSFGKTLLGEVFFLSLPVDNIDDAVPPKQQKE